jgi:hypothetical protein
MSTKHEGPNDIWNKLIQLTSEARWKYQREEKGSYNKVNANRSETWDNDTTECISGLNLTALYALDRELNRLIREIVDVAFHRDSDDLKGQIAEILSDFETTMCRIDSTLNIVDFAALPDEIAGARKAYDKGQRKRLKIPENMNRIGSLQYAIQTQIESIDLDGIEKADAYLKSFRISFPDYVEEEALVYLRSREIECDDAIQHVRTRWCKQEAEFFSDSEWRFWPPTTVTHLFDDATMLRVAEVCGIGGFDKYWERIAKYLQAPTPDGTILDYYTLLPFFRSDYAIRNMRHILESAILKLQEYLGSVFKWGEFSINEGGRYFVDALASAVYIFGAYTINSQVIDAELMKRALAFLLKNQQSCGAWWDDSGQPNMAGVYQAVITVLALHLVKPDGYQGYINRAFLWIKQQQTDYGYWRDSFTPKGLFLSILVLDAIELTDDGTQATFTLPTSKSGLSLKGVNLNSTGVLNITANTINLNVHGESVLEGKPKKGKGEQLTDSSDNTLSLPNKLLEDKINIFIFKIYQDVEQCRKGNINNVEYHRSTEPPSYVQIAKMLKEERVTQEVLTKQAIAKRVKKLKEQGLLGLEDDSPDRALRHNPKDLAKRAGEKKEQF